MTSVRQNHNPTVRRRHHRHLHARRRPQRS